MEEPGGVPLRLVHMAEKAGTEGIECIVINTHKLGKALLDANTAPTPTKGTASIKPVSRAVEATTTRPKVLEPREKHTEWSELQPPLLQQPPKEGMLRCRLEALLSPLRECKCKCNCRPKQVLQRTPPP